MAATGSAEESSVHAPNTEVKSPIEGVETVKADAEVPSGPSKRKRYRRTATGGDDNISFTTRNPPWAYLQLELYGK